MNFRKYVCSVKVPETRGCTHCCVGRNPYNGYKYLCGATQNGVFLMQWYEPLNKFMLLKVRLTPPCLSRVELLLLGRCTRIPTLRRVRCDVVIVVVVVVCSRSSVRCTTSRKCLRCSLHLTSSIRCCVAACTAGETAHILQPAAHSYLAPITSIVGLEVVKLCMYMNVNVFVVSAMAQR